MLLGVYLYVQTEILLLIQCKGGIMGSLFSYVFVYLPCLVSDARDFRTLQFIVSPHIGSLSDKYGRKKILLLTMIGNIVSALVYVLRYHEIVLQADEFQPQLDQINNVRVLPFVSGYRWHE